MTEMMRNEFIGNLVSVIIPLFNSEKYIDLTLCSVFAQTYKNIEIIIVDDNSKDKSGEIITKYQEVHPEIVYYRQNENYGAGVSRNKALELARGKYVAFLDSDDVWLPNKIEKQLELMNEKNTPFSYTAIEMIDDSNNLVKSKRKLVQKCNYKYLLRNTIIATSSVVIDRSKLGDFKMSQRRGGQDYATWLMLLRGGTIAYGIDEALVKYRVSKSSLSSNKLDSIRQVWEVQTKIEKIPKLSALFNVFCFIYNALKKYIF